MKKNTKSTLPASSPVATQRILLMVLIALLTYFSFSPALKNGFTNWDDNAYVFENKHLAKPLPEAAAYFFEQHYFIGNYIPVTMLVYAMEYHAAGLNPKIYHQLNLFIHLANVLLVFWFIYRLSGKKLLVASVVSLFFGIHPMHVESVAWIAELKDVLYASFFILALIFYLRYLDHLEANEKAIGRRYFLIASVFAFFVLSLLAKPAAIILPFVLPLLDFYRNRLWSKRLWLEKLPFLTLSVIFGLIALKAQQADRLLLSEYGWVQKIFFASHSFLVYLLKAVFPIGLSIFYPYPATGQLPLTYYLAPVVALLLLYLVYRSLRVSRLFAFGFLFFLVNLLLVLQFVSVGHAVMAERYTYIAYLGLFFIFAMTLQEVYEGTHKKLSAYKAYVVPLLIGFAVLCSFQTYARCKVWKSDETIANDLLSKHPDDPLALNNKGYILYEQGRYNDAVPLFEKALATKPDYKRASINLANSFFQLGNYDRAMSVIEQALQHNVEDADLFNQKAFALHTQKKCEEAISCYDRAIRLKKESMYSYIHKSGCQYDLKQFENSVATLNEGLKVEPENYILLNNKGYILFVLKRYEEAARLFRAALQIQPDYRTAQVNLDDVDRAMKNTMPEKK